MATRKDTPRPGIRRHESTARSGHTTGRSAGAGEHGIYATHFTSDEVQRILADIAEPNDGLDASIDATYVLLDRIIGRLSPAGGPTESLGEESGEGSGEGSEAFLKLVAAHNQTTGRIANLLRARKVVKDENADSLTGHIAAALDELAERLHVDLS